MKHCPNPNCGAVLDRTGACWKCGRILTPVNVPQEVRRTRKVVDLIWKDVKVAEKVAEFLGIQ